MSQGPQRMPALPYCRRKYGKTVTRKNAHKMLLEMTPG